MKPTKNKLRYSNPKTTEVITHYYDEFGSLVKIEEAANTIIPFYCSEIPPSKPGRGGFAHGIRQHNTGKHQLRISVSRIAADCLDRLSLLSGLSKAAILDSAVIGIYDKVVSRLEKPHAEDF